MNPKNIAQLTALALCLLNPEPANAGDINIGKRGPTNNQAEVRITHAESKKSLEDSVNLLFKYWDGKEKGKWGFVSIPYSVTSHQIKNFSVGAGPRYSIGDIHILPYVMIKVIPKKMEPNIGTFATLDFPKQNYQIDFVGNYDFNNRKLSLSLFSAWNLSENNIVGFGSDYNNRSGFSYKIGAKQKMGNSSFEVTVINLFKRSGYTIEHSFKINF